MSEVRRDTVPSVRMDAAEMSRRAGELSYAQVFCRLVGSLVGRLAGWLVRRFVGS